MKVDKPTHATSNTSSSAHEASPDASSRALRGMSYDQQVQQLAPGAAQMPSAKKTIPLIIEANTSETALTDQTAQTFGARRGQLFDVRWRLAAAYGAGSQKVLPAPAAGGPMKGRDYLETPGGIIDLKEKSGEKGSASWVAKYTPESQPEFQLKAANNGTLCLSRLARATYNVLTKYHYGEDTDASGARKRRMAPSANLEVLYLVRMGNKKEDGAARDHKHYGGHGTNGLKELADRTQREVTGAFMNAWGQAMEISDTKTQALRMGAVADGQGYSQRAKKEAFSEAKGRVAQIGAALTARINRGWVESPDAYDHRTYMTKPVDLTAAFTNAVALGWKYAVEQGRDFNAGPVVGFGKALRTQLVSGLDLSFIPKEQAAFKARFQAMWAAEMNGLLVRLEKTQAVNYMQQYVQKDHEQEVLGVTKQKPTKGGTPNDEGAIHD